MTTASHVAVVATRVAETDRRALSQAWYSALHLADDDTHPSPRATAFVGATGGVGAPRAARAPANPPSSRGTADAPARVGRGRDGSMPGAERRSPASDVTRRVERAVATIARTPLRGVSRTVTIDGGRVRLLLRSDGNATRIVALCSEPLRATVERALAHARFALAARGASVNPS